MNNYGILAIGYFIGFMSLPFILWLGECVNPRQLVLYWCHCGYRFRGALSKRIKLCPRCGDGMYAEVLHEDS